MGLGCSYHPYECSHDHYCEHCCNAITDWHNPKECWLCCDGDPATNKPQQWCKDPFKIKIWVTDWSSRRQKVKVRTGLTFTIPTHKISRQGVLL